MQNEPIELSEQTKVAIETAVIDFMRSLMATFLQTVEVQTQLSQTIGLVVANQLNRQMKNTEQTQPACPCGNPDCLGPR